VRARTLEFFGADPAEYDLVFVANATAAIKLVADGFRDYCAAAWEAAEPRARFRWLPQAKKRRRKPKEFHLYYHRDAHTSVVGVRELAARHRCLASDADVESWIGGLHTDAGAPPRGAVALLAYPGQSNMTGRRLPLSWSADVHRAGGGKGRGGPVYTLLDAAALATTKPLRVSEWEPDFVAVSFYKIFGFPDLGALLVRRSPPSRDPSAPDPARILTARRYFGGGTVDMVAALDAAWFERKAGAPHDALEDGTVPFHSVIALGHALDALERVFGGIANVGRHTARLTRELHAMLAGLTHSCGAPLVRVHNEPGARFGDADVQGATVAFSVLGAPAPPSEAAGGRRAPAAAAAQAAFGFRTVERLADARAVYVRSGSLCNPGGFATYLRWTAGELRAAREAGHSCSAPRETALGKPTGVVRVSLGACSSRADVVRLVDFLRAEFVDRTAGPEGEVVAAEQRPRTTPPPARGPAAPGRSGAVSAAALAGGLPPTRPVSVGAVAQKVAGWGDAFADAVGRGGCAGEAVGPPAVAKMAKKKTLVKSVVQRRSVVTTVTEI
jgi:molybdenum cofactor sulfurtransferase